MSRKNNQEHLTAPSSHASRQFTSHKHEKHTHRDRHLPPFFLYPVVRAEKKLNPIQGHTLHTTVFAHEKQQIRTPAIRISSQWHLPEPTSSATTCTPATSSSSTTTRSTPNGKQGSKNVAATMLTTTVVAGSVENADVLDTFARTAQ